MRHREGKERPFVSLFIKSVVVLILIGILPLLVMGIAIYNAYAESIKENLLSNMYRTTLSIGRGVESVYQDMVDNTNYLYEYRITGYDYFYELMEDDSIQEKRRTVMMSGILESILYRNPCIDHVFFITVDGRQYSVVRSSEAVLSSEAGAADTDASDGLLLLSADVGFHHSQEYQEYQDDPVSRRRGDRNLVH